MLLFVFSSSFTLAQDIQKRGLETNYPEIRGIKITATSSIGTFAVYLFSFAIIIGAILTFAVLIYGGIRYVTSSGNPEAMGDAKKWILGAIIGLILLLCSWFIIGIINEGMLSAEIKDIEATAGIYIVDKSGKKIPYIKEKYSSIPEYIDIDYIEFISDKPASIHYSAPDKDELYSVFVYSEKNFEGTIQEIKNEGAGKTHNIGHIGSMVLLWWKPGIYLYDKEDWGTESKHPRFHDQSQINLKDFDNETKSLRIVNSGVEDTSSGPTSPSYPSSDATGGSYYVILFEKPNFNKIDNGKCGFSITNESSLSGDALENVKEDVSSIMIFRTEKIHGEVIIYDEIAQKTEKQEYKKKLTGQVADHIELKQTKEEDIDIWNSIAINANATVIISTNEDNVWEGYCRPFGQYSKDGDNLISTSIYHKCDGAQDCEEYLPEYALIIPHQE